MDDLKGLAELGYDEIIVRYRGPNLRVQSEQLKRFVDEIIPQVV